MCWARGEQTEYANNSFVPRTAGARMDRNWWSAASGMSAVSLLRTNRKYIIQKIRRVLTVQFYCARYCVHLDKLFIAIFTQLFCYTAAIHRLMRIIIMGWAIGCKKHPERAMWRLCWQWTNRQFDPKPRRIPGVNYKLQMALCVPAFCVFISIFPLTV